MAKETIDKKLLDKLQANIESANWRVQNTVDTLTSHATDYFLIDLQHDLTWSQQGLNEWLHKTAGPAFIEWLKQKLFEIEE